MAIKVIRAGLSTSIQDKGRYGRAASGVPVSGVMDSYAADWANRLLNNDPNDAVLEMTRIGPCLRFDATYQLVLTGLKVEAYLNKKSVPVLKPFVVNKGDILDIKRVEKGNFAYLAVKNGFQSPKILSARSLFKGVTKNHRLTKDTFLSAHPVKEKTKAASSSVAFTPQYYAPSVIKVYSGPEFGYLNDKEKRILASKAFTVSANSNRMAFTFEEKIGPPAASILTAPVIPGTAQLTPGGQLIVLMKDAQVTGGYPRIFQLKEKEIGLLAQKTPGKKIRWVLLT